MENYQHRVEGERVELLAKIRRLENALDGNTYPPLSEHQAALLKRQRELMIEYALILAERLREWSTKPKDPMDSIGLQELQQRQKIWSRRNFGEKVGNGHQQLLGVVEEVGELAHAHLKAEQGIRQGENHEAMAKDAIGDIVIYLAGYCNDMGYSLSEIVTYTWKGVEKRDWIKNPETAHMEEK